mgnify:CR=1 FL=1
MEYTDIIQQKNGNHDQISSPADVTQITGLLLFNSKKADI